MEPKNRERLANLRRSNRKMPRRRLDLTPARVSFKDTDLLSKFTTETGRILPRRITGVSAKLHRKITREIKRARAINLLP
ncbi:30S ribosomal protein S18 [bacterium]|jgi:small subunit ribosomal protein S18|nr:30S ribosomal protein S18 [Verrucomicrobiales bacterium]MDB2346274.1 30S ribosomal protein S18 [Verrucomicrobiales bacterium]MDC3255172.1 30S ribosomal protein S18 [bacterium]MDF1786208.1 30S ribosomal protein S18 [Verrucomicrobiales bacterium]NCF92372.1 30S ribosomal protein S18 [Verrucomicrobiaceae bacterium]